MSKFDKILTSIYKAIDIVNPNLTSEMKLEKSQETILFGENGKLDSLGLVNFIVAIEGEMADAFGVEITLADEKAMSQKNSPFKNIDNLAKYIDTLIENKSDE